MNNLTSFLGSVSCWSSDQLTLRGLLWGLQRRIPTGSNQICTCNHKGRVRCRTLTISKIRQYTDPLDIILVTAILLERDLKILDSGTTGWWVASPIILSENCFQPTILYHAKLSLKCEARKDRFSNKQDFEKIFMHTPSRNYGK